MPGRGWAITPGPAICIAARSSSRASSAGAFPIPKRACAELPGIGPYTAAAIAAIAFDRKATAVDGNIERVVARLFAVTQPLPGSKPEIRRLAGDADAGEARRGFRPGDDGSGRHDLRGRPAEMHALPLGDGLPRPRRRHRGRSPGALAQAGAAAAPWRRLLGRPPRRRRAAAPPAGGGAAGRDDGVSLDGLARDALGRERGGARGAGRGALGAAAGAGAPRLHPFRAGAGGAERAGGGQGAGRVVRRSTGCRRWRCRR